MGAPQHPHQRAMEHRHHRRPLPAGGDVGGAEVVDHRNAEPGGQLRPVAELDGEPAVRPVQHGLAVKADHLDLARRHAVGGQEGLDRLGMGVGHQLFRLGEELRPLGAVAEMDGGRDRPPQHGPFLLAVGPIAGRPDPADGLAVGIEQRHVHPVIGGAAHQADGRDPRHSRVLG